MLPSQVAVLLAAALAADPGLPGPLLAQAVPREIVLQTLPEEAQAVVLQALPSLPDKVVRTTRYFGTVTVDHRAHLARRAACKSCHGPGQVSKLTFTPAVAHDRCVGCHREEARGPTSCRECHVKQELPETKEQPKDVVVEAKSTGAASVVGTGSLGTSAPSVMAFGAASAPRERITLVPAGRVLEIGTVVGAGIGPSLRLTTVMGDAVLSHTLERMSAQSTTRTTGLLGVGISQPIRTRWSVLLEGVGGFDAVEKSNSGLYGAVGARAGLQWEPRTGWFLSTIRVSTTAIGHLSGRTVIDRSGATVFATVGAGFTPSGR